MLQKETNRKDFVQLFDRIALIFRFWLASSSVISILLRREDACVGNAFDRSFARLLFVFAFQNVEFSHESALASFAFVKQTSFRDQIIFCSNGAEIIVARECAIGWLLLD